MNKISIIIPVLNEEDTIEGLLSYVSKNTSKKYLAEIIVVDGGSSDNTKKIVSGFVTSSNFEKLKLLREVDHNVHDTFSLRENTQNKTIIKLLNCEKGRAKQMNFGAKHASGDILYFLHADSFPPKQFLSLIIKEVNKGHLAGCFRLQFDSNHWWLKLASWLTQFKWRACRGGDQSLFITKKLFLDIGGYNEAYIIYEDHILISDLYSRKQFVVINKKLKTSSRLYMRHGIWKLQYHFLAIYIKKWLGASAKDLHFYYLKHIA